MVYFVKSYTDKYRLCYVHRFVYECHNGPISQKQIIEHVNNNKEDNRLCNLQITTHKKQSEKKDYSFNVYSNGRKNKQCVRGTNLKTKEIL